MPLSPLPKSFDREKTELQLILNAIVEGPCEVSTDGNVTFCNEALLKITSYWAEELIGSNLHEMIHRRRSDYSGKIRFETEMSCCSTFLIEVPIQPFETAVGN
jgi:PAS domain S-box-containing protein